MSGLSCFPFKPVFAALLSLVCPGTIMASHTALTRAFFSLSVFLMASLLSGCWSTREWYGLSEKQETIIDSLFHLNVVPHDFDISVHVRLTNPLMETLCFPRVYHDSVDGATWSAALQQYQRNVKYFYQNRCAIDVQCYGDSTWLRRRFSEINATHNGDAWYTFTCNQPKQKLEEGDSIRVVVLIDTTLSAGDDAPYRREYILKPYSKTQWDTSLRLAH